MPTSDRPVYAEGEQQCSATGFQKSLVIHVHTTYFQSEKECSYTVRRSTSFSVIYTALSSHSLLMEDKEKALGNLIL